MKNFTNKHLKETEKEIKKIEHKERDELLKAGKILMLLGHKLEELKEFVTNYEFKNEEEEISFFKEIKPRMLSKLIYYMSVYKIEVNRPTGSRLTIETYLFTELDRLKHYFDRNIELYRYYRTGCYHLDELYFLRNHDSNIPMNIACFYFERDIRFSTGYDYKIAKIIANDFLELYLKSELLKLDEAYQEDIFNKNHLIWTASKTDLVELIYALHSANCINNGNITIKELTSLFENIFNITIGDIYHIYSEIRERKESRTLFLDRLKEALKKKMDEADGVGDG